MPPKRVADHRGIGRRVRHRVSVATFRKLTLTYNRLMTPVPDGIKYPLGTALRRFRMPYATIRRGDVAVQVGAPRDILAAGRGRAAHFTRLVGQTGKVVVVEPDPANCAAFREFLARNGYGERVHLFENALWSEPGELVLYSSPLHPASNILAQAGTVTDSLIAERQYQAIPIAVRTLDDVLDEAGVRVPKVVSITTNGAELQILAGMLATLEKGVEYIALAETGPELVAFMDGRGYEYVARDDRGYTFRLTRSRPGE